MWPLLRMGLHALPPETAHNIALAGLRYVPALYHADAIGKEHKVMGLSFPNRVGLAAGFDKSGDHIASLVKLGFGFIEIGTITPKPQPGSSPPRLFRLPKAGALINRMGFNNLGADHAARQLAKQAGQNVVIGCNIGRNKDSTGDAATQDYVTCLNKLYGFADYYTVNVSSPNTTGLRDLQTPELLKRLLGEMVETRQQLSVKHKQTSPMLVKVAPDLSDKEIKDMASIIAAAGVDGVIATNTTTARPREIELLPYGGQPGGLSGAPLRDLACKQLRLWRKALPSNVALIGVGGISSGEDAKERFDAKADLVQVYTGLIYKGPQLVVDCAAAGN